MLLLFGLVLFGRDVRPLLAGEDVADLPMADAELGSEAALAPALLS